MWSLMLTCVVFLNAIDLGSQSVEENRNERPLGNFQPLILDSSQGPYINHEVFEFEEKSRAELKPAKKPGAKRVKEKNTEPTAEQIRKAELAEEKRVRKALEMNERTEQWRRDREAGPTADQIQNAELAEEKRARKILQRHEQAEQWKREREAARNQRQGDQYYHQTGTSSSQSEQDHPLP